MNLIEQLKEAEQKVIDIKNEMKDSQTKNNKIFNISRLKLLKSKIDLIIKKDGIEKYCLLFETLNCTCMESTQHSRCCETNKRSDKVLICRFTKKSNISIYQDRLDFRFINRDIRMYYDEFYKFENCYEDIKIWVEY